MSDTKIEHWAQLLPESGRLIESKALAIVALRKTAYEAYQRALESADKLEEDLYWRVQDHWTQKEIDKAHRDFSKLKSTQPKP